MRHELTPETLGNFQNQFRTLHDSVIDSICVEVGQAHFSMTIKTTSLKDIENKLEWYNLTLYLEEVADIRLIRNPIAAIEVILDARIEFHEDNIVINFHPTTFKSDVITSIHKDSQFLVIAKRCSWEATKIESN